MRNPEFVKIDMELIASQSYSHVLHTWSEEDLHYYRETMGEIIASTVRCGMQVYVNPWGVGRVFGGEAYSELAARNPAMAQVNQWGESTAASCPNSPHFRKYMHNWLDAVCATQVETIFWDEPHFYFEKLRPDMWACLCSTCQKRFRVIHKHSMPASRTNSVMAFRENSLVDFLAEMTEYVARKGKRNSVCLLPPHFDDGLGDWERVASLPHVHEIGCDPYWEKEEKIEKIILTYRETSLKILELARKHKKDAQMWIKNYHIVKNTEDAVAAATWAAFNAGIRNIFAWSYRGSEYMSWLRSDNPQRVWEIQTNAFLECRKKCSL